MQRNPAYYLLSQHHQEEFSGLKLIKNEKYALIQLLKSDISEARTFDIQGKTFNLSDDLSEHHLSIYKEMAVQKAKQSILGPFHHTMHLNNSGKNLSLRVYYDCYGKYIESIVKCEREEKEDEDSEEDQRTLKVLECEQLQIRRASESCIKNVMEKIFVELEDKCSTQEKAQNKLLLSLKNESEKNGESQEYLALLDKTIIAVREVNAFSFRPNIAVENFLLVRRDSIKKIIEEKSLTKLTIQEKQQLENNLAEEEIDISSMSAAVSQPLMQADNLIGLFDRPLEEAESRVTHITEKQKIINQLWNIDGLSDLNFALSIIEKQKKLDQLREKYLEQACQKNDVQTMRDLFNEETDIYLVKKLMHTAISFRHKESFDFLSAKRTLNYLVKWDQCVIVGEGEGLHGAIARLEASPLQLAYKQRDFHVFTQLLASGAAHPDERNKRVSDKVCKQSASQ